MSPDGYITITGRIKDLIIRGGENIHPLEIENCLLTCPGVANVSVVGVPDERYGEVVAAFVIPRERDGAVNEAETIREWVRKGLSHHLGESRPPETVSADAKANVVMFQFRSMSSTLRRTRPSPRPRVGKSRNSNCRRWPWRCSKGKPHRHSTWYRLCIYVEFSFRNDIHAGVISQFSPLVGVGCGGGEQNPNHSSQ